MDEYTKIAGIIAGIFTVLAASIRWLISNYFDKAKELESIKENWTKDALSQLKLAISGLRTDLCRLSESIAKIESEMNHLRESLDGLKSSHEDMKKRTSQFKNTKLVKFNEDLYLIKKKE